MCPRLLSLVHCWRRFLVLSFHRKTTSDTKRRFAFSHQSRSGKITAHCHSSLLSSSDGKKWGSRSPVSITAWRLRNACTLLYSATVGEKRRRAASLC